MNERERKHVLKCVKVTIATGPLATYQISVQSVHPFPGYGEGMHTCTRAAGTAARAHVAHADVPHP